MDKRFPLKVVVFTSGPMALPTISYLSDKRLLAGIILGNRQNTFDFQNPQLFDPRFIAELNRIGAPYFLFDPKQENSIIEQLMRWEANIGLILGFPRILSSPLIHFFSYGIYNIHASALPKYRGSMPLYWQIRNQEPETAITLHKVEKEIDSGNIIIQHFLPIHSCDTLYSLAAQITEYAPTVLQELLDLICETKAMPAGKAQHGEVNHAPWPDQHDIFVNWATMSSAQIAALARAGNAGFGATLLIRQKPVTLFQATPIAHKTFGTPPGTLIHIGEPEGLLAATKDAAIRMDIISTAEGLFGGIAFAERFQLDAGMAFEMPIYNE